MLETSTTDTSTYARHRLAWLDQLAYELFRVTGRSQLMQCLWLYDRDVNRAALVQTYERLIALSFNRLIEPSSLPWGRPRWVAGTFVPFEQSSDPLPRSRLLQWANQQARAPVDPVIGPAGRMAIQPFDDGSTAVSIVGSHLVLDGMGALRVIAAAVNGTGIPNPYLPQGARGRLSGCLSDAWQILADAPQTVAALARIAQADWSRLVAPRRSPAVPAADAVHDPTIVELPSVVVSVESRVWLACEQRLGGGMNTLLPGFVASLASRLGRRRLSDGAISLLVPRSRRRGLADERALAIEFHMMNVAPEGLTKSLEPVNDARALLRGARKSQTDVLTSLLPAIALMPRTVARALVNRLFDYADELPVSCSDLGMLPEGLARIDGAPCRHLLTRAVDVNVTRQDLERSHGHLVVVASRYDKTVSLCIEACQLRPAATTVDELRLLVSQTLTDFGLEAVIDA
ncbi:hypothetical protein [Bradyrhizobium symbiodeficiens]|uniref:Condensation domain-containing protein n=1 Tax=Bradyrhizobium symbiodeficiens TaxID=1404367 RepID=A0A6G9A797_9BRAD|nr:hypothetical protein [Bradyrhizobium symbiodeficiens]QIP08320.1 hypothetical protein HAV00_19530 [Bradyrhizobium symbiodeficiens]